MTREIARLELKRDWKSLNGSELGKRLSEYFKNYGQANFIRPPHPFDGTLGIDSNVNKV